MLRNILLRGRAPQPTTPAPPVSRPAARPPRREPARHAVAASALALVMAGLGLAVPATASGAPDAAPDAAPAAVSRLGTSGNQIVDAAGTPVQLRGVSVLAPRHNAECPECHPRPISDVIDMTVSDGWQSDVVRLPVTVWGSLSVQENVERYVDPYVQQAVDLGIYIIVDLHHVSDYGSTGVPRSAVSEFWDYVAPLYADVPNVIYEVFNEPVAPASWSTWKSYIQPVVDDIRAVAPQTLLLVGSPQWSTYVNQAAADPVAGNDIAYVYHLYPNQGDATAANLDARFGNAARQIPVILTEFGWNPPGEFSDPTVTVGTTSGWGIPLRQYLDARPHISWTAWIFDNYWKPQMFDHDWNLLGGEHQGAMIKAWLADQPYASPCASHAAVGATAVASSAGGTSGAAKAVDGDCTNAGRWLSAEGDTTPTLTITLDAPTVVDQVDVYSGYVGGGAVNVLRDFAVEVHTAAGWQQAASFQDNTRGLVSAPGPAAAVDQVRLVVTDPSDYTPDVARVFEVAVRTP
ncbi:cellulase family glycosylhydrolase [Promicromonospora thailandica]|uniref:cellulase n=1 Tax=Promicromonospora thailandica TaxID=765201 RepID=A0A9X2K0D7_9MICO|nr:cellulase family glycosylhydrolase [Promicromonospora thailandica]MCP2267004.1 F5/8 type C domain-containing protein [Promicromonospora thailandica]